MKDANVCIIDYGSGNVKSVYNLFLSITGSVKVSNQADDINGSTHIVLPGVGAFGSAMQKIKALSSFGVLEENVLSGGKPFLGICVGMQVLAEKGYEHGENEGLGWIPGSVRKLETGGLYLPHVGWNDFTECSKDNPLFKGISPDMDFYYVHSFYFDVVDKASAIAKCEYGMEFTSAVNRDNIYGVQFHPEKSQKAGRKLLQNFMDIS
ncbi:MAG: imidazole glycerol phosphate synthase subunit HisH [Candidatus Omnitrophica bacterium]|nr:imidazole glycerol phosphate synthase subunit HisH [Candidatus Omnitrophota bacterium]